MLVPSLFDSFFAPTRVIVVSEERLREANIFMIRLDKIITMTESKDEKLINLYNHYINGENTPYDVSGIMKPNSEMGYISSVSDARKKLEKVFKLNQET